MAMKRLAFGLALALFPLPGAARAQDASAHEFFEKEVRPLLVARCQSCHGSEKQKGGLRLDSRATALKGGENGPAVVPGKPGESLLVDAINYGELVQMPPKSKLPAAEVATLTKWVAIGAPWTSDAAVAKGAASTSKTFSIKERAGHWSLQPLRAIVPPAVKNDRWPRTGVDCFLLKALETRGIDPAPDADRRTLVRRVTFDLVGLPPTPEDVEAFVHDESPRAYANLVERLLESPHYGERWARHWLDLVRYAETSGHEFDYEILGAWRYRDYVIRAFNADVPYNQFVIEHIAGDLVANPRRHPALGTNESILGTGFFLLGEGVHSPVDLREEQIRRVDNQIDVFAKAFLGLTVACARCHDHKFDAISTKDYYALFGYLRSSRHQQAFIDAPECIDTKAVELDSLRAGVLEELCKSQEAARGFAAYLTAAERAARGVETAEAAASQGRLDVERLRNWIRISSEAERTPGHPLRIREPQPRPSRRHADTNSADIFEDFSAPGFAGWSVTGQAFGSGPTGPRAVRMRCDASGVRPALVPAGIAHSGLLSNRLQGVLRSRTFTINRRYVHFLATGQHGRINLVIDGFEKNRDPIYGGLILDVSEPSRYRWYSQDVSMWQGHPAYIELADGAIADFTAGQTRMVPGDGFLAVDEIRLSDAAAPAPSSEWGDLDIPEPAADSPAARAEAVERGLISLIQKWRAGELGVRRKDVSQCALLARLCDEGLLTLGDPAAELCAKYREIEATIPAPTFAPALLDGTGDDEHVLVRGSYKTPGELVPRRFLEVLAGPDQSSPAIGSGRLELAHRLLSPTNPLPARVLVNRLWKHHFGAGLVRSVDDFGAMGERPSHPELLDWLAHTFIERGWSIKAMHREIVLSRAYQMASTLDPDSEATDPENRFLHRMNVRRLEGEAIRDAILAVSGRLDRTLFGASVPVYLNSYMDGRGRPVTSGPLDGVGRRTIYLGVRRNFLNPMLLAFDYPPPASAMGRRNVSNVPAQALTLLNDPFVLEQARVWASRLFAGERQISDAGRIEEAYLAAFARPPTDHERDLALSFLDVHDGNDRQDTTPKVWADFCHVLFNAKEFVFIP
jgi:hypothetical protein